MKQAVVIGAGIGGIAAAIRLAKKGYRVQVFESTSGPGGKLSQFEKDGFRFDRGPSLFTLPQYMRELFDLCGEKMEDYFSYSSLQILCKYFYEDGTTFEAKSDLEANVLAIAKVFGEEEHLVRSFFHDAAFIYETTAPLFLERPLKLSKLFWTADFWKGIFRIPQLPLRGNYTEQLSKYFKNPKTIQYFQRYATYNGSSPYKTPALMQLMPHVEQGIGAFIPDKGMFDITKQLVGLAERHGVVFHFGSKVKQILLEANRATGILMEDGMTYAADLVVSNMDVFPTYKKLLPTANEPKVILNQEKSSSALIFYWGMNRTFEQLDVHNILFSADYRSEFHCLFETKKLSEDPTVYIHITSKHIAADAPASGENWFVMVNVPHRTNERWEEWEPVMRERILQKIERQLAVNVRDHIVSESSWNPEGIENDTSSHLGALYGNASNSASAAFFRHANHSREFSNLFFVGGSVHPGGGVPLAILSAKTMCEFIPSAL